MAAKSWSLLTPADDALKNTVPGLIRDVKEHAFTASGFYAEQQSTPDQTIAIYAGIVYFGITKVEYAGLDIVDLGTGGGFETTALTASYYNKVLFTINSSGILEATEGTENAVLASVVEPAIPAGKFPICMVSVQDDGTATAGTILTIEQSEIQQLQGVSQGIVFLTPAGEIKLWPSETPPTGFLECNGASISRTTYANLFAVIGTLYGTADGNNFNIPDYRGRFLRSWDHAKALDPDRATRTVPGATGATITAGDHVGTEQADTLQGHKHGPTTLLRDSTARYPTDGGGIYALGIGAAATDVPITDGTNGTPRTGSETRSINTNIMTIIKY